MTNFKQAQRNGKRGRNQKDGGRRQPVQTSGFWGIEGFLPTRTPGEWTYDRFTLVEGAVDFRLGWIAICEDGRRIPIGQASAEEIKIRLNDEIAKLTGIGPMVDIEDWMTADLPQTNPPVNPRPGVDLGVIV